MADAIQIPAERLVPVAKETASGAKTVAAIVCCALVLFIVAGIAMIAGEKPNASTSESTQEGASAIVGLAFWWVALGAIAQHFIKKGKRATEVSLRAQENHGFTFFLDGKRVLVNDPAGIPQPQLSFKVSSVLRKVLLEVPRATIVS